LAFGSYLLFLFGEDTSFNQLTTMGSILNIVAIVLIILWLVGYIGFGEAVGSFIHVLLVLAIIAILIRIVAGRRAL
jgi:hypothetical protein